MQTLAEALATLDAVDREIERMGCTTELRDAMRRYANAQRKLIKAINKFDRRPQLAEPARRRPKLYLVRH
jgi:hypothetical protein